MPRSVDHQPADPLLARLCRTDERVVYFPVRHHSPACAKWVVHLIKTLKPVSVLIEGPSDFNDSIDQLLLPHQLPIAVYSYFRPTEERSLGAFYPFCEYSPEWVAIRAAIENDARPKFIDLPWADVALIDDADQRYADGHLRYAQYVNLLCERFGVESFDELWDKLIESDVSLALPDFLVRVHGLCYHSRLSENEIRAADIRREAFMADCIDRELKQHDQRVLVVTGGFHSSALAARLEGLDCPGIEDPADERSEDTEVTHRGITLTPYTYQRLDNHTGYNAGMPSPGFYDHVWRFRPKGSTDSMAGDDPGQLIRPLIQSIAADLRKQGQAISSADLIAVETTARSLARLRGRRIAWRSDLLDGVTSALVKDETAFDLGSPFVDAVLQTLRGNKSGRLADGAKRSPLMTDILDRLEARDLMPVSRAREIDLSLLDAGELDGSRLLHSLRILRITGIQRLSGPDFLDRTDLTELTETWRLRWNPEFDAGCAEASRYGTTLSDAVAARLSQQATESANSASEIAALLVEAAQAGLPRFNLVQHHTLETLIHNEPNFMECCTAIDHLLYLYCFDEVLQPTNRDRIGELLGAAFERGLWLLESLGQVSDSEQRVIRSIRLLLEAFQRAPEALGLEPEEFSELLTRVAEDTTKLPSVRGAVTGTLWSLGTADSGMVLSQLKALADPEDLGDFLAGTFSTAREVAQRNPELVQAVDHLVMGFDGDQFDASLPSMRMAFTYFTPREKHYMLSTLFEHLKIQPTKPLGALRVDSSTAARALAIEDRAFTALARYKLRGAEDVT